MVIRLLIIFILTAGSLVSIHADTIVKLTGDDCSDAIDISSFINSGAYPQSVAGDLTNMTDDYALASCSSFGGGGAEMVYSFVPDQNRDLIFGLCEGSPQLSDSVLYIRTGGACPGTSEYACDDDSSTYANTYLSTSRCSNDWSDGYHIYSNCFRWIVGHTKTSKTGLKITV